MLEDQLAWGRRGRKEKRYLLGSLAFKLTCAVGQKWPLGGGKAASPLQCRKKWLTVVRGLCFEGASRAERLLMCH